MPISYVKVNWLNQPSTETPISQNNLRHMDDQIYLLTTEKAELTDLPTKVSDLTNDSGFQTSSDVASAISAIGNIQIIKGRVDTYGDLPSSGQSVGDTYFVGLTTDTDMEEYVWTADETWEKLGKVTAVDLADYYNKEQIDTLLSSKVASTDIKAIKTVSGGIAYTLNGTDWVNVVSGDDGATFIPAVTSLGVLSWTNNKGYPNPSTVNVRGKDLVIKSLYPTLNDLETIHPTGAIGDVYAVGNSTYNELYIWNVETSEWTNIGSMQNPYVHPNHTGEVISDGDGAQTIANGAVTLAKMANMATLSLLGRATAGTGAPEVLSIGTGFTVGASSIKVNVLDTLISSDVDKALSANQGRALKNLVDSKTPLGSPAYKNWIINGMFDVWQRGTSQTTFGYGSDDRWNNGHAGSTKTHSSQAFTAGQTEVPNNPKYFSRTIVSSVAGTSYHVYKVQVIEDVTKLAGKTVTLSFWAKSDAPKNIALEFTQSFGTEGSPEVNALDVQKVALTAQWQRFTKTVTLPSVAGKTISDGNHTGVFFWFEAGTNLNTRTDTLGQQSGTFDIANVSLVEGNVAVECQNQPYADVLRECQRYYQKFSNENISYVGFATSDTHYYGTVPLKVTMRTLPSLGYSGGKLELIGYNAYNISGLLILSTRSSVDFITLQATSTGLTQFRPYSLVANNIITDYIAFDAEL